MVVFELEQALGRLITQEAPQASDLPSSVVSTIVEREITKSRSLDSSSTLSILSATYLDETFALAKHVLRDKAVVSNIVSLQVLCTALDLQTIRNAISHPNRPFLECYWYRAAAIATDPVIERLGLFSVTQAFCAAQDGNIELPPEKWLTVPAWSLPNNLPERFDHAITGLIGRKEEYTKLKRALENPKFPLVALTGPGGVGKTAMALEVLQDIALSLDSKKNTEQILYLSAKTESLSISGIVSILPAVSTLEDVSVSIASELSKTIGANLDFESACTHFADSKILLCIDNLETLIRDNPDIFDDFYNQIPSGWRILVTSRVPVNSANTLAVSAMSSAMSLALVKNYTTKRGGTQLDDESLNRLVDACQGNPLAIRLTIDACIAGKPFEAALAKSRSDILSYSYRNLIEILSDSAIAVLECLAATVELLTRVRTCQLLDLHADEAALAFGQLMRTSLVTRAHAGAEEAFTISSSVRDLLLLNPRNQQLRDRVLARIRQTNLQIGEHERRMRAGELTPLDLDYVPPEYPDHVKYLAIEVSRCLNNPSPDRLFEMLAKVRQHIESGNTLSIYYRLLGWIFSRLGDRARAIQAHTEAIGDNGSGDVASMLAITYLLRDEQRLEDAKRYGDMLLANKWDDPARSSVSRASDVIEAALLPRIWVGEFESVVEVTSNWQQRGATAPVYARLHATALRRNAQGGDRNSENSLILALDTLDQVYRLHGYSKAVAKEGLRLIEECLSAPSVLPKLVSFVDLHIVELCNITGENIDRSEVRSWIQRLSKVQTETDNPFAGPRWLQIAVDEPKNVLSVRISNIPRNADGSPRPYVFAKDYVGVKYYISRAVFEGSWEVWKRFAVGCELEIVPSASVEPGKLISAERCWEPLNQTLVHRKMT